VYEYSKQINTNLKMLKGKFSRSVDNSAEDGLCMFIVVLRISRCNFLEVTSFKWYILVWKC